MTTLPGNPHYERSEASQTEHGASVHATLALANEQRTANLIAYIEAFGGGVEYDSIWADIRARLGLGAEK